jgi:hypothetical protein
MWKLGLGNVENEPLKCGKSVEKHVFGAVKNSCPAALQLI